MEILAKIKLIFFDVLKKTIVLIFLILKRLLALFEFFLFLRLFLKFLNANPLALVVDLLYAYTDILVFPFEFIFPDIYWPKDQLIEVSTISAMAGYAILVFVILQLFKFKQKSRY